MQWITAEVHQTALIATFILTFVLAISLSFIDVPYGRKKDNVHWLWGPALPLRTSWMILEAPVFFSFGIFFFYGPHWTHIVPVIMFMLFQGHYFHRTFVYPRSLKAGSNAKGFRLSLLLAGMPLNILNGFLNGWFLSHYADHLYSISWLFDPRFLIGLALFIFGFTLAKQSEHILTGLRKPGENGYKIPLGGGFHYVSNPHYLGELIQWSGFAIACWSLPGLAFVCICLSNLLPRALHTHHWYHEKFPDYPKERKALIPFVI